MNQSLSNEEIVELRIEAAAGVPRKVLVEKYNTSKSQVSKWVRGVCNPEVGGPISGKLSSIPFMERRSKRIVKDLRTGCELYLGGFRDPNGYGKIKENGRMLGVHRLVWEHHNGPIPDGLLVCHHCDTPACSAIEHLFLGTHQDNTDDMIRKGRHNWGTKK